MFSRRRVPIQAYLAALFALVTLAIGLSTAALLYGKMKSESLSTATLLFDRSSALLADEIGQVRWKVSYALGFGARSDLSKARTFADRLRHKDTLTSIVGSDPLMVSAYVGYPDGSFLLMRPLQHPDSPSFSAPPGSAYLLQTIDATPQGTRGRFLFYDANGVLLRTREEPHYRFDPRTRPWFAARTNSVFVTAPYLFFTTHHLGITLAQRSQAGSVFGSDIDLATISERLGAVKPTPSALAAIAEPDGTVLAFSNLKKLAQVNRTDGARPATLEQLDAAPLVAAFNAAPHETMTAHGTYRDPSGRLWLYRVTPALKRQGGLRGLIISMPEDELLASAVHTRNVTLLASAVLIVFSIPLAFWLAGVISRPLKGLRGDALAIRNQDFSHRPQHDSFITEIDEFARTFDAMRQHIRDYNQSATRFIPREFLSQLGRSDIQSLQLGDHAEETMTILFSDIRSFTTLSGGMTPEQTFKFVNSYLTRIGPIIREYHGFIDKYIGDAIMALFPQSPKEAVEAAIAMQKRVVVYNEERARAGYQPVKIGIGVHTGDLMLGTIGETERFETTVISDAVNIASRLESLTKTFGVLILASGAVISEVNSPTLYARRLGDVQVKGATHPVTIYDVFEADPIELLDHKMETREAFEFGRVAYKHGDFTEAYRYFREVARNKADHAAAYYRDRSAIMASAVRTLDWDGVEHMESK